MQFKKNKTKVIGIAIAAVILPIGVYLLNAPARDGKAQVAQVNGATISVSNDSVSLTDAQLKSVSVTPVGERVFTVEREAVGLIDFNEDMTVQVSPPYQGRIAEVLAKAGDDVRRGQMLFTIDSPDLVQAESALISTDGVLTVTSSVLSRAKELYAQQGLAQKDYQQAVSDQQAAQAAFNAARNAVKIFGKTDTEIAQILKQHRIDAKMPVLSPIAGRVTARNAAPGTLIQPGATPAPFTVSNLSTKWMLAATPEADIPLIRLGQGVDVKLAAFPDRMYHGTITNIGAAVDPNTHRVTVRSEIADPKNEMQPQMFATFVVHTGDAMHSPAVPYDGIVREGDGSMTVWVMTDRRTFTRRTVRVGLQQDGHDQITSGLNDGELVATKGALFISNALALGLK